MGQHSFLDILILSDWFKEKVMGVAMKQHILQVVDWKKYSLEEWLYQFGAWQHSNTGTCGRSINPIAVAMDQAVVKRKKFKLGVTKQRQVIADYMVSDIDTPKPKRNQFECNISDDEARAVQRLVLDIQGNKSDVLDGWLDAIISRYFYSKSWADMVIWRQAVDAEGNKIFSEGKPKLIKIYSENDARADVKCGLAALHVKYPFIEYKKTSA